MVTDPTVTKVALICDQKYTEKSNSRSGGAGTEAQIITPELYARKAQDKFVAIICQRDENGKPYIPAYYGSRIYIDLSNPPTYAAEFDKLVRWVWDQPLYVKPKQGSKPTFLTSDNKPTKIATAVVFRRAYDAVTSNSTNAPAFVRDYLSTIAEGLEEFRISSAPENGNILDELIINSINEFQPYRNEIQEMFGVIAQYSCSDDMIRVVHRFFEQLLPYTERPERLGSWSEWEFDNFRFVVHELFLITLGVFLRFERFDAFSYMVDTEYFWENPNDRNKKMYSHLCFREHLRSLDHRNQRLQLRRLSLRADMLHDRNKETGLDFKFVMAADFIIWFRSWNSDIWSRWWPETLLYARRFGGAFELFARAKSIRYFNKIKGLLQIVTKDELGGIVAQINMNSGRIPQWDYEGFNVGRLLGFDEMATTP